MAEQPHTASQATEASGDSALDKALGAEGQLNGAALTGRSGIGSAMAAEDEARQAFVTDELAIVLSHYDIGTIEAIQPFLRGSRKAPKLVIRTDHGLYLLKRRAPGKDDPFKVAFCHAIQLRLADQQFPLPHLIGTRRDNNSMLRWKDRIYELFEFIKGTSFDLSPEATADAGKSLALFHKLLANYEPEYDPPRGSYHAAASVATATETIPQTLARVDPPTAERRADDIDKLMQFFQSAYDQAAETVEQLGLAQWPKQIVHGDWHPGNMLFRGPRVVAVIDYDGARIQQRVIDVANGALQFSITGKGDDPALWPEHLDEARYRGFLDGYDRVPDCVLSRAELDAVPWLMIEALIAESIIPIAATGSFARMEGVGFLLMVERKVRWLQEHGERLAAVLEE